MVTFLIILIIIACALLVLVILAQNPKGGGVAGNFASGSSQLMGVKRTADLLEKLTWGFIVSIFVLAIAVNLIMKPAETNTEEDNTQQQTEQPAETK